MVIGITGGNGFLGWHMRCFLHSRGINDVRVAGRETFSDPRALDVFVTGCDVVFHFAGVNRANDEREIAQGNPQLAQDLVESLERTGSTPFIVYSSSTHADGQSVYGIAKRKAGEIIGAWADRAGTAAAIVVFPHLYGESGKPFYNSVVHTFCHQLADGEALTVTGDGQLELLHAQDAVAFAWSAFAESSSGELRPRGRPISVRGLATLLERLHSSYSSGVVPDLRDVEDRKLFNTLRSAMFPAHYPMKPKRHEDPRGWLFEAIREENGGQVFLSSTNPGFTRGNNYHRFKVERFCVLSGRAVIRIRQLFSGEVLEFPVSGDEPAFIDMPPLHTHSISNEGEEQVLTLFWSNEFFDSDNPDTYPAPVIEKQD